MWADLNGSNSLTTRYIRGDVIDQLFARQDAGTPYWYLTDHLGSIRDVLDSSAVVKDALTYDGFGNITAETDSNYRGRYAWTGREIDQEIQLQYNRARYYDAATGRWTSQDPLGFDAGDSNLYRYVQNSPINSVDPSGLLDQFVAGLELKKIEGPSYNPATGALYTVSWKAPVKKAGYIIQAVTLDVFVQRCNRVPMMLDAALSIVTGGIWGGGEYHKYITTAEFQVQHFELWEVRENNTIYRGYVKGAKGPDTDPHDIFEIFRPMPVFRPMPAGPKQSITLQVATGPGITKNVQIGGGTKGQVHLRGVARYFEGTEDIPSWGPVVKLAGVLPSSWKAPSGWTELSGKASASHRLSVYWDFTGDWPFENAEAFGE